MADLYMAKVTGTTGRMGLVATDGDGTAALSRIGDGEEVRVKIVQERSVRWNRMYFGVCDTIGQNQDPARDKDSIDMELRVLAGHYDVLHARKGNQLYEVRTPKRLAFDKMTAEQWAVLWPSLELAGRERFGDTYFDMSGGL